MNSNKKNWDAANGNEQQEMANKGATDDNAEMRQTLMSCRTITDFQRKVYVALLDVPCGETITYAELARRIGCRSAQAVGQALRRNPFAPRVPCHRVIAANGGLGGYHGATSGELIEAKKQMLDNERKLSNEQKC